MERRSVTHHGRTTAYYRSDRGGEGAGLLFVHGAGGSGLVWKSQARLADQYPVAAVDLSGHGESDDVDANAGYETLSAYAADVLAVAGETDPEVVVGNSMGGALVLHVLLERDYDPDAVVLAGTGPRLPVLDDLLSWLDDDFERALEFLHAPGRLFADPDERVRSASLETMREAGRAVVARDFRTCHWFDIRGRLDEISTSALAVVGEHDRLTPRRYHEELAAGIDDCELAVIEDAAHLAMLERPSAFNTALVRFLDRL